jgi:hypothetical protein
MQPSFERFAGACALLTGTTSFLYALAFVIVQNVLLSAVPYDGGIALFPCACGYLLPAA